MVVEASQLPDLKGLSFELERLKKSNPTSPLLLCAFYHEKFRDALLCFVRDGTNLNPEQVGGRLRELRRHWCHFLEISSSSAGDGWRRGAYWEYGRMRRQLASGSIDRAESRTEEEKSTPSFAAAACDVTRVNIVAATVTTELEWANVGDC